MKKILTVSAAALLSSLILVEPAFAQVTPNSPPVSPHGIISFPARDFVHGDGWDKNTDKVTVEVLRNGVVIGSSPDITPYDDPKGGSGIVEVNHPKPDGTADCWQRVTPDIMPGDVIRYTTKDTNGNVTAIDETPTANVTVTKPGFQPTDANGSPVPGTIVVQGTAQDTAGNPLPKGQVQQRMVINAKNLTGRFDASGGKRDIRAGAGGGQGTLVFDPIDSTNPKGINWTATYKNLDQNDMALVLAPGESRALWLGRDPLAVTVPNGSPVEGTIYEAGVTPGPTAPCTAPLAQYAVTSSTPAAVNSAFVNGTSDLTVSGASQDASSVSVTLSDGTKTLTTTSPATPTPATGAQSWSVTFPQADVASLADGPLTATGTYTIAGPPDANGNPTTATIGGQTLAITKDTAAPTVNASPAGSTVNSGTQVTLSSDDPKATIFYTNDGKTDPTPTAGTNPGTKYTTPISITGAAGSQTTLKFIAVDVAGNQSPVGSETYTIQSQVTTTPPPGATPPPTATTPPPGATPPAATPAPRPAKKKKKKPRR